MHVVWWYQYRLSKSDSAGELLRRVAASFGSLCSAPRFAVEDHDGPSRTSAVERIVKKHPQLAAFQYESQPGVAALANLSSPWLKEPPRDHLPLVDQKTLAAIADGTPRSFPSRHLGFHFEFAESFQKLPAVDPDARLSTPSIGMDHQTGITLISNWWVSRRELSLAAMVRAPDPTDRSTSIPPVADAYTGPLQSLGKFSKPQPFMLLSAGESKKIAPAITAATKVSRKWKAKLGRFMGKLGGIEVLPANPRQGNSSGLTSPHKDALVANLRPRKFRYRPGAGSGCFLLDKSTTAGNRISLSLDVGSWSHFCSCHLRLEGVGWSQCLPLRVTPNQVGLQYAITDSAAWEKVVHNLAILVDALETSYVAEVEKLFPPAPRWWSNYVQQK